MKYFQKSSISHKKKIFSTRRVLIDSMIEGKFHDFIVNDRFIWETVTKRIQPLQFLKFCIQMWDFSNVLVNVHRNSLNSVRDSDSNERKIKISLEENRQSIKRFYWNFSAKSDRSSKKYERNHHTKLFRLLTALTIFNATRKKRSISCNWTR